MKNLTGRQQFVLSLIARSITETGRAPTIRELMASTGIASKRGVVIHLIALEAKGCIDRVKYSPRGIVLR